MVNFVLVAGARLGAAAWDDVAPHLERAGHHAHPLTLSGLAEKSDRAAGQQTHVQDIVDEITTADLRDVILVGHSYAGVPVGQAAGKLRERLLREVFVDASVPTNGQSFLDSLPDGGSQVRKALTETGGFWDVPPAAHFVGEDLTNEQISRIISTSTPHPGRTLTEPAQLATPLDQVPTTYIKSMRSGTGISDELHRLLSSRTWQLVAMETGHWPMFSQPRELAQILIDVAAIYTPTQLRDGELPSDTGASATPR